MHVCSRSEAPGGGSLKVAFLGQKNVQTEVAITVTTAQTPVLDGRRCQHLCVVYFYVTSKYQGVILWHGTLKYAHVRWSNPHKFQVFTM